VKTFKLVVIITVCLILILTAFQNTALVETRFLWFATEMPAILLIFLAALGGFILGLLSALLVKSGGKNKSS
jgi:uncharacterized integral membrane protein